MELHPLLSLLEVALHVLARRFPAAGYRKVCSCTRRKGYAANKKKVQRLLGEWGFTRSEPSHIRNGRADPST
jgi:hypothetical protein